MTKETEQPTKTVIGDRIPENSEIFPPDEAKIYAEGCDYPESADYTIVAVEIAVLFGNDGKINGRIVEVCPGPGNLCGELLNLGATKVIGVDASPAMIAHASQKFAEQIVSGRMMFVLGWAQQLPFPDDSVDGIVNFNSFHQFSSFERAQKALEEMARVLEPGGWGLVRDFKRGASLEAVQERLKHTKPEIAPLLLASLDAAFTPDEFRRMLTPIPNIEFSVVDTEDPRRLSEKLREKIAGDPVAHYLDHLISQHVIIKKKGGEK